MDMERNIAPLDDDEEMDIEIEEEDIDAVLSDDSCYDSDMTEDVVVEKRKVLNQAEINTLNNTRKMCCIQFYYMGESMKFCTPCIIRIGDLFSRLRAVREHDTDKYIILDTYGLSCSSCKNPLYQIMPCNLCPICT